MRRRLSALPLLLVEGPLGQPTCGATLAIHQRAGRADATLRRVTGKGGVVDQLRVELKGIDARLGAVPAADVARTILALERAVAWTASVVTGRPSKRPGRRARAVEFASDLRLVAVIEGNSIDIVVSLPEVGPAVDDTLEIELLHLSRLAAERIVDAALGEGPEAHPYTVEALSLLTTELDIGQRYTAVQLTQSGDGREPRTVTLDEKQRFRLEALAGTATAPGAEDPNVDENVLGRVVAADFEQGTGRVRRSDEVATDIRIPPDMARAVKDALLEQASLAGRRHARELELQSIRRDVLPVLDAGDFWAPPNAAALENAPHFSADDFYDPELTGEERDDFVFAANNW